MVSEALSILLKESSLYRKISFFSLLLLTSASDLAFLIGVDILLRGQSSLLEGGSNEIAVVLIVLLAIPFRYAILWTLLKIAFNRASFSTIYLFRHLISSQDNLRQAYTESQRLRDGLDNGLTTLIFHYLVPFIHLSTSFLSIIFVFIWLFFAVEFCCLELLFSAFLLFVFLIYVTKFYVTKKSSNINVESRKLQMIKDNMTENIYQIFRRRLWDLLLERLSERSKAFWKTKYVIYFSSILPRFLIEFAMGVALVLFAVESLSPQSNFSNFAVLIFAAQRLLPFITQSWSNYGLMLGSYSIVKEHWKCFLDNENYIREFPEEEVFPVSSIELNSVNFHGWHKKLSLHIKNNDKVLIYGKSGIGKSRLLKSIAGLDEPESGSIVLYSQDSGKQLSPKVSLLNVHYLSQSTHIIEGDVYLNISLSASFNKSNIDSLLSRFDLKYLIGADYPRLLLASGGELQRLALCRAVYSGANVLLLDEFTSALDRKSQELIMKFINEIKGVILVIVSHRNLSSISFTHKVEII